MEDGSTRDIALLTRVGKPVCFVVTGFEELADGTLRPVLSRRQAQQRCPGGISGHPDARGHHQRPGDPSGALRLL